MLGGWAASLGALWLYMSISSAGAVSNARDYEKNQCRIKIESTVAAINSSTDKWIEDAKKTADSINVTADVAKLCGPNGSVYCRDKAGR